MSTLNEPHIVLVIVATLQGQSIREAIGPFNGPKEAAMFIANSSSSNEVLISVPLRDKEWYTIHQFPRLASYDANESIEETEGTL